MLLPGNVLNHWWIGDATACGIISQNQARAVVGDSERDSKKKRNQATIKIRVYLERRGRAVVGEGRGRGAAVKTEEASDWESLERAERESRGERERRETQTSEYWQNVRNRNLGFWFYTCARFTISVFFGLYSVFLRFFIFSGFFGLFGFLLSKPNPNRKPKKK